MKAKPGILCCIAIGLLTAAVNANAAGYPDKPIVMISPYAAGGPADLLARLVAKSMTAKLGVSVIVEDKPGAGSTIGANYVAKAAPDGYTVLVATPAAFAVMPAMMKTHYDGVKDFTFIGMIDNSADMLVINPKTPAKNLKELIALAKAKPDALNYGTAGIGTSPFMDGETFKKEAGINMHHIPYKGAAPALADLVSGQVQVGLSNTSAVLPFVRSGQLRALAYASTRRSKAMPDVPTFAEQGLRGVVSSSWRVLAGPAGVPAAVVDTLSRALTAIQAEPEFQKQLAAQGSEPFVLDSAKTTAYVANDAKKSIQLLSSLHLIGTGLHE